MSRRKKLVFGLILLAGTLGFIEAAASLFYHFRISEQERETVELVLELRRSDANSVLRYIPHPYFNYVSNPEFSFKNGYRPHNAIGLRGPFCCPAGKSPGHVRIVAVGGSTTYGMYFTYERHVWPALLQERLQQQFGPIIEVINAGVPNYTSYEMMGLMAMRVPEFKPDIVLIHIGLNDAFTVGYPDEGGPDNTYFRHAFSYKPPADWLKSGMRASYLLRIIGLPLVSQQGFSLGDMAGAIQYSVATDAEVTRNAEQSTGKYFHRNLQTLIALSRNMGAIPVLINEPLNPQRETGQSVYYTAVVKAVDRNNQIAKQIAEKNGIVFVDLYAKMRDPQLFVDAAHENQTGMQAKTVQISTAITPLIKDLVKKKSQSRKSSE